MIANALSDKDLACYYQDGYVLVRGMLNPEEVTLLGRAAREDRVLDQHSYGRVHPG